MNVQIGTKYIFRNSCGMIVEVINIIRNGYDLNFGDAIIYKNLHTEKIWYRTYKQFLKDFVEYENELNF